VLSLKELGVAWAELGHHERRLYFGETDGLVRRKIELALARGLSALVCVGELEAERAEAAAFVGDQVESLTKGLALDDPSRLVAAYEPRWAIGVDKAAPPEHARECCRAVREALVSTLGPPGSEVRIIYGGSVKPEDAPAMLALKEVSGLFIGRAALDTSSFAHVVGLARDQAERDLGGPAL
jgi:triosephosphate isomerase